MSLKKILFLVLTFTYIVFCNAQETNRDSLRMDSVIHSLPEVMVKGSRPLVKVERGKLVYDLPHIIEKRDVDNIYDAIKEIPGVTGTEEKLLIAGSTFTVIINGKKLSLNDEQINALLKTIPISRLKNAEVILNAPAKYQVRGTVVNINLKSSDEVQNGLQGEFTLAMNNQHHTMYGERGNILYHRGKFSLDAMLFHEHGDQYSITNVNSHHTLNDGTIHDIKTKLVKHTNGHSYIYRLGMDYDFADNHKLSLAYNGQYATAHSQQDISQSVQSNSRYRSQDFLHNLELDYDLPIGLKVSVDYTHYHTPDTEVLTSVSPVGEINFLSTGKQNLNLWKFALAEDQSVSDKVNINYGIIYSNTIDRSGQTFRPTGNNTSELPENSNYKRCEDIVNIYVGTDVNFSQRLMFSASIAEEYYHNVAWHNWNFYPNFTLTYVPSNSSIFQLGFSCEKQFPEYWSLQNFTSYSNGGYSEIVGNPQLKPSNEYTGTLAYIIHNKYQLVAFYNQTNDYFVQTPYQRHDRLVVQYKYLNFNYQRKAGLQAVIPFNVGSVLDGKVSVIGTWLNERCDHYYDVPFNRHNMNITTDLTNTFTLTNGLYFNLDGYIRTKAIQAIYDLPASGSVNVGLKYQFLKKRATLHIFCNDIFQTAVINPRIHYKNQNMKMNFSCYRTFGVSFIYNFGGYKTKEHDDVDTSRFKKD